MKGSVTLILGSMRSSKSAELQRVIDQAQYRKKKACIIRHDLDKRPFVSRLFDIQTNVYQLKNSYLICDYAKDHDILCIDEGQFFDNIGLVAHELALQGKEIYIAALNGDAELRPWPNVSDIIPYADKIVRLKAVCEVCKKRTYTYSYHIGKKEDQIEIGDTAYKVLCRKCYDEAGGQRH